MKNWALALRNRSGLTLIEIMIVAGLVSVLTYALTTIMVNSTRQAQSVTAKTEFNDLINTMQSLFNNAQNCTKAFEGVRLKQNATDFPQAVTVQMGGTALQAGVQYGAFKITKVQFASSTTLTAANQYLVPLEIEVDRGQGAATAVGGNILKNTFELAITVQPPWSAGASPDALIIGCAGQFNNQWVEVPGGIAYTGGKVGVGSAFNSTTGPTADFEVRGSMLVNGTAIANDYIYQTSDRRLKENIREIPDALDRVLRLHGVLHDWKSRTGLRDGRDRLGLLAQEVEQVFPEAVTTDPNSGMKAVAYGNLISPLIEAVKEQHELIRRQQRELDELRSLLQKKTGSRSGR